MRKAVIGLAVLMAAAAALWFGFVRKSDGGITLTGSVLASDPEMVYAVGTPDISPGGVLNGCSGATLEIGSPVLIQDTQGKVVASGTVESTFHWENEPTLAVSRNNHGCEFRFTVKGVPKLPAYDVGVGFFAGLQDVAWDQLDYNEYKGKITYQLPPIRFDL